FIEKDLTRKHISEVGESISLQNASLWLHSGEEIKIEQAIQYFEDKKYLPAFYVGDDQQIAAVVFEKAIARRTQRTAAGPDLKVGDEMANFSIPDIAGDRFTLSDMKGKVVVINFWFIGCGPCRTEIPHLNKLVKKYESDDVVFVAVALDGPTNIKKFLKKKAFTYRIAPEGISVAKQFNITYYPTNMVLDQEGKVAYVSTGYSPAVPPAIDSQITKLLK
ncbi:MAG: TlpA disulfide reductase family protein, partial [Bacteroidota bacterium]